MYGGGGALRVPKAREEPRDLSAEPVEGDAVRADKHGLVHPLSGHDRRHVPVEQGEEAVESIGGHQQENHRVPIGAPIRRAESGSKRNDQGGHRHLLRLASFRGGPRTAAERLCLVDNQSGQITNRGRIGGRHRLVDDEVRGRGARCRALIERWRPTSLLCKFTLNETALRSLLCNGLVVQGEDVCTAKISADQENTSAAVVSRIQRALSFFNFSQHL